MSHIYCTISCPIIIIIMSSPLHACNHSVNLLPTLLYLTKGPTYAMSTPVSSLPLSPPCPHLPTFPLCLLSPLLLLSVNYSDLITEIIIMSNPYSPPTYLFLGTHFTAMVMLYHISFARLNKAIKYTYTFPNMVDGSLRWRVPGISIV